MASAKTENTAAASNKIRLKLFINKNTNKVLYAEAGKDFVDFLLHTFTKPLGLAIKEDFNGAFTSGLGNLYTSVIDDLSLNYLQSGSSTKAALLSPNNLSNTVYRTLVQGICCKNIVYSEPGETCQSCKCPFSVKTLFKSPSSYNTEIGYVKGEVNYMITDDLVVKPLSTSMILALLNKLCITDLSNVTEIADVLDSTKGKELVKASLNSKTVLTDTFLPASYIRPKKKRKN